MMRTGKYSSLCSITSSLLFLLKPPERLTVASAASKYRVLNNKGSHIGRWQHSIAPYMVEPMEMLTSVEHDALIFVGAAQTSKTESLILNWITYSVIVDPMDMIIYNPTRDAARDFSQRRVDRLNRSTPELRKNLLKFKDKDNTFDKVYKGDMLLKLSHPSPTEFAGRPVGRIAMTDYDRMPDDIGGEGAPYDLAKKRTTTFGSYKMIMVESSPSRPIENLKWVAQTKHEAPPTKGVLGLYNNGDRRRWYWPCPSCDEYFEGSFNHLVWNESLPTIRERADSVKMKCPHCGVMIDHSDKHEMQQWGKWVKDGQTIDKNGRRSGTGENSRTVSFWIKGVAAAFTSWSSLVEAYLNAVDGYERTGDELSLQAVYNTELAEPYIPKAFNDLRLPEELMNLAEPLPFLQVPEPVRFLIATIDVQKHKFVVQVSGIAPGEPFDIYIIDRFDIKLSNRFEDDGVSRQWIKPATYLEDWDILIEEVINKKYQIANNPNYVMGITRVACDSGGYSRERGESVSQMAYEFYRKLRSTGMSNRFSLVKGVADPRAPRVRLSYPDAPKKDKFTVARGDVPVLLLQSNLLKDGLNTRLDCELSGKGMIHFPNWLPLWFYNELCAEARDIKGWVKTAHANNEAWDLLYYTLGLCVSPVLNIETVNWSNPPAYASEDFNKNPLVFKFENNEVIDNTTEMAYDFAKLGSDLG